MTRYALGNNVHRLEGPVGKATIIIAVIIIIAFLIFLRRNEHRLEDEAERAMPGPLDAYQRGGNRDQQDGHRGGTEPHRPLTEKDKITDA